MNVEDKVKKLKAERMKLVKAEKYYDDKRNKYYDLSNKQCNKISDIDMQLQKLTHKCNKGDLVVLGRRYTDGTESYEIAQITSLVGAKRYKVFRFINSRIGTVDVILEDEIICSVKAIPNLFELKRKEIAGVEEK